MLRKRTFNRFCDEITFTVTAEFGKSKLISRKIEQI